MRTIFLCALVLMSVGVSVTAAWAGTVTVLTPDRTVELPERAGGRRPGVGLAAGPDEDQRL